MIQRITIMLIQGQTEIIEQDLVVERKMSSFRVIIH